MWKGSKPGEPAWDSPWGPGRPGWHIECSAMSMKYFGETMDIHGGGLDLQFPHHENELAQSESFTGCCFARVWMHNGLLKMGKGKMAGSVGNVINVVDALKHTSAEVLRFFMLSTHYRSPIDLGDFNPETQKIPPGIENAQRAYETFVRFIERYERITKKSFFDLTAPTKAAPDRSFRMPEMKSGFERFTEFMNDDFNTGGAVGVLFDVASTLNRLADSAKLESPGTESTEARQFFEEGALLLKELGQILGLFFEKPKAPTAGDDQLVRGLMQLLIDLRAEARKTKNFAMSDEIRKRLTALGVTLEDRPGGTEWRTST
jgi:cysteinyl-tRNA synthetase